MSEYHSGGVRCLWMRGGTSKGGYFLADDLPADPAARDAFLRRVMGSPDPRQIDGMGGADPLTSKVAVVSPSRRAGVDVDYLFLQVSVDEPLVSGAQTCGNILAGVGPFAIERGLVPARDGETPVTIYLENTGQTAVATVQTPGGEVGYAGKARIDGVPGAAAPVPLQFRDTAGATCGALLPTGRPTDRIEGFEVTLIDNGMPCVVLRAEDAGIAGTESRETLDNDAALKARPRTAAPGLRPADDSGRRGAEDSAENDHGERAAAGRGDYHPDLHPAPLPRHHRRARRGQRRHRLPAARIAGRGAGRSASGQPEVPGDRASRRPKPPSSPPWPTMAA